MRRAWLDCSCWQSFKEQLKDTVKQTMADFAKMLDEERQNLHRHAKPSSWWKRSIAAVDEAKPNETRIQELLIFVVDYMGKLCSSREDKYLALLQEVYDDPPGGAHPEAAGRVVSIRPAQKLQAAAQQVLDSLDALVASHAGLLSDNFHAFCFRINSQSYITQNMDWDFSELLGPEWCLQKKTEHDLQLHRFVDLYTSEMEKQVFFLQTSTEAKVVTKRLQAFNTQWEIMKRNCAHHSIEALEDRDFVYKAILNKVLNGYNEFHRRHGQIMEGNPNVMKFRIYAPDVVYNEIERMFNPRLPVLTGAKSHDDNSSNATTALGARNS
eukprot:TRINITY_DN4640_c0_g2_i7.p1 TRINITY_DN4640_c0_g2~~TRINITY_DN4640_c0_g2_i7.p1  ORF type:complete len:325 (-),score=49.87 TRINITY_DN4640_c0_g2_i7:498-1472(-)